MILILTCRYFSKTLAAEAVQEILSGAVKSVRQSLDSHTQMCIRGKYGAEMKTVCLFSVTTVSFQIESYPLEESLLFMRVLIVWLDYADSS